MTRKTTSTDLHYILKHLSVDELETAARSNYEYSIMNPNNNNEQRIKYASKMAQRFLDSKSDKHKALAKMKATIQFRIENDIDSLRTAANDPTSPYHVPLTKFLSDKKAYVSGYDNEGRSTLIFVPRRVTDHDSIEWTRKGHIWNLERAIACSKSEDKTVNAIIDFADFSTMRHAPPTAVGKDIMTTLRDHYVGHVNQIFLVNAPTAFLLLWKVFKPFAGKKTRDKIHFINNRKDKQRIIGRLYNEDQVTSWMLPSGKKNRDLDIDEYMFRTPFNKAFDE